jgi:uncharacterized protein (DUF433 family)
MNLKMTQDVPLEVWEDGSVRVKGSRVPLDAVVRHFKAGETAEGVQDIFPSLNLRDIYGALYYYLDHTAAVEEYLAGQEREAEETRRWSEQQPGYLDLRARLQARRQSLVGR